jgi:hypothetical protein
LRTLIWCRSDKFLTHNTASIHNFTYFARVVCKLEPLDHIVVLVPDVYREQRILAYVVPEIGLVSVRYILFDSLWFYLSNP